MRAARRVSPRVAGWHSHAPVDKAASSRRKGPAHVKHRRRSLALAAVVSVAASYASTSAAQAPGTELPATPAQSGVAPRDEKDPIRGSTFIFDQSATTSTVYLENGQQSRVPFYGWWMSLRPRWNFTDKLSLRARFDYYKEFTNQETTTYKNEDVFGDIWTDFVYSSPLSETGRLKNTKVSLGARALWPVSKESRAQGTFITLGALAGVSQKIDIRGENAKALNSARLGLSFTYLHAFTQDTTAATQNLSLPSQDFDGRPLFSSQLTGQTLAQHTLYAIVDTGLQITPKLGFTLDWILINNWHYQPTATTVNIATGPAPLVNQQPDNQFTQLGWFLTDFEYEVIPEISLGLGYYNLANTVGPNGQANSLFGSGENNLLWSPDARVFFDVTANLDKIYEAASGRYKEKPAQVGQTAEAARAARVRRIAEGIAR